MNTDDQTTLNTLCNQIPTLTHGQTITTQIALGKTSWHTIKIHRSDRYAPHDADYTIEITEQYDHLTPQNLQTLLQSIPEHTIFPESTLLAELHDAKTCANWAVSGLFKHDATEARRRWTWLQAEEQDEIHPTKPTEPTEPMV